MAPVQWWAAIAWWQKTGNWSDRIQVPQWVLSEVAWWSSPAVLQGLPLVTKETEVTLFTDASSSGWGAQLGSRSTQGQWSVSQRSCHINILEMQAVIYAVRDFLPQLRSRVVRLMCGPSWELRVIPGKLPTWCQGAYENLHNKCMNLIGQDSWRSVGRKDGTCFESEVVILAPTWCTSSGTDYYPRR